jgi:hypothetical protein
MKTVQFPPLCPFGDLDDAAFLRRPSSAFALWSLTPSNDRFLLLSVYEDGDLSYIIDDPVGIAKALDERVDEDTELGMKMGDDGFTYESAVETRDKLREWGFYSLIDRLPAARKL